MKAYIVLISLFSFINSINLQCNGNNIPLNYYDITKTTTINIFPYIESNIQYDDISITRTDNSIKLVTNGNFGTLFLDLNHSYQIAIAKDSIISYVCNQIELFLPSVSKFWNINTDAEMIIYCSISTSNLLNSNFNFNNNLTIVLPVIAFNNKGSSVFTSISSSIYDKYMVLGDNITMKSKNISIEKDILSEGSDMRFLLYNYYSFLQCNRQDTYIVFNSFISILSSDFKSIKDVFTKSQISQIRNEATFYNSQPSSVFINWEQETDNKEFEDKILNYEYSTLSCLMSIYYSRLIFIVIVVFLN